MVEASDQLYNELAEIETHKEFGSSEKKIYEREIKDWMNTTDTWGTWLSAMEQLTEKMNKAYVNLHK